MEGLHITQTFVKSTENCRPWLSSVLPMLDLAFHIECICLGHTAVLCEPLPSRLTELYTLFTQI